MKESSEACCALRELHSAWTKVVLDGQEHGAPEDGIVKDVRRLAAEVSAAVLDADGVYRGCGVW
jgi:hypothetical protein